MLPAALNLPHLPHFPTGLSSNRSALNNPPPKAEIGKPDSYCFAHCFIPLLLCMAVVFEALEGMSLFVLSGSGHGGWAVLGCLYLVGLLRL